MGKRDIPIVVYFQDDERYADLLDVHIFGGRRVVTAEDIREKDSRVNGVLGKVKSRFQFQKYRDAVRRVALGTTFVVIALEHQDQMFGFIQRSENMNAISEYLEEHRECFEHLEEDAYNVIAVMTGSKELEQVKEQCREEGGTINMCQGLKDWLACARLEARQEGLQEGLQEGRQEGHQERHQEGRREGQAEGAMSKAQTVAHNMFNRSMSAEDTAAICEESLEQVQMWFAEWGK